ncbi:MAG: diguanylate cyclase [Smithellaceae bacterium]|nr:diguanylate cyclase [Smithellaceae bacterium]
MTRQKTSQHSYGLENADRILIIIVLAVGAILVAYFYSSDTLTSLLYLIPIILSSLWWRNKGIVAAALFSALLIGDHVWNQTLDVGLDSYRVIVFFVSAILISVLKGQTVAAQNETANLQMTLSETEDKHRSLINSVNAGVLVHTFGPGGRIIKANPAFVRMMGYSSLDDLLEVPFSELLASAEENVRISETLHRLKFLKDEHIKFARKNGTKLCGLVNSQLEYPQDGPPLIYTTVEDVTASLHLRTAFREAQALQTALFENTAAIMLIVEADDTIVSANANFEILTGYLRSDVEGKKKWTEFILKDQWIRIHTYQSLKRPDDEKAPRSYETLLVDRKGGIRNVFLTISSVEGGEKPLTMVEITERRHIEEALRESAKRHFKMSITDGLTKLYNSRHFYNQLQTEVDRATRHGYPLTLLLMDVDNFKHFNDSYGHLEGDGVLVRLARVIEHSIRASDTAYRYGGEEFVVLLPETSLDKGLIVAERIRADFKEEIFIPNAADRISATVSIGVAQYRPSEEPTSFVERADQSMYRAKQSGKNKVVAETAPV